MGSGVQQVGNTASFWEAEYLHQPFVAGSDNGARLVFSPPYEASISDVGNESLIT